MERACLKTEDLIKIYQKRTVVDHVSLEVRQGDVVGILGPNGAGKTTTFRMVVGLIQPDAGKILFNEQEISKMAMYSRARLGIGYLPQEPTIFARLTVVENLMIILEHFPLKRSERIRRIDNVLGEMKLDHLRQSKAGTLSGGERRRLEIARTLLTEPSFIMLDEPFAAIDPKVVESLQDLIKTLKAKNIGILITDHKPRETLSITDHTYIISKGKILRHGKTKELVNDEEVRKLYLGERFIMPEAGLVGQSLNPEELANQSAEIEQLLVQNLYEEAIQKLNPLIQLNSQDQQAYFQRGFCFYRLHDYTSAKLDFYRVWQMNNEYPNIKQMLLKCQEKLGVSAPSE